MKDYNALLLYNSIKGSDSLSKITMIEIQKRNKKRYSVYVDDKFALGVSEDTLIKYNLKKGLEIDETFLNDILKMEEQVKANSYALNLLSYRARSEKEIVDKMKEKEYESDVIEKTIKYLYDNKYLDDKLFAEAYARDKINFKKIGKQVLKQELYQKGVDKEIVAEIVEELVDEDIEYENALNLAIKKRRTSYRKDDKQALYRKLGAFLQRKGYTYDIVSKVLKEVIDMDIDVY